MEEDNNKKISESCSLSNIKSKHIFEKNDFKRLNCQIDPIHDKNLKYQQYLNHLKQEATDRSETEKDQFLFLKNYLIHGKASPRKKEKIPHKKIYNEIKKICGKIYNENSNDIKNYNSIDVEKIKNYYLLNFKKMQTSSPKLNLKKENKSPDLKYKIQENSNSEKNLIQNECSLFNKRLSRPKQIIYRTKFSYENYASNTASVNHPQIYRLKINNHNSFKKTKLPPIGIYSSFGGKDMRSFIKDYSENNVFSYNKRNNSPTIFEGIKMAEIHKFGNIKFK